MSNHSNTAPQRPATATKRPVRLGTSRDLAIGIAYFVALLAALGFGGHKLCQWKQDLDRTPPLACSNPVWSFQGDHVAFLQEQRDALGNTGSKRSLWTVDQRADETSLAVQDLDMNYQILGWFDNDENIILQAPAGAGQPLTLLVVDLKERAINRFTFNDDSISVVGHSADEVFLQRQFHNSKSGDDELELLTWSTQKPELAKIIAIPNRPNERINIASATPNADAKQLALVLRSEHASEGAVAVSASPSASPAASVAAPASASTANSGNNAGNGAEQNNGATAAPQSGDVSSGSATGGNSTGSDTTNSNATNSNATGSNATNNNATNSDATNSNANDSNATNSNATGGDIAATDAASVGDGSSQVLSAWMLDRFHKTMVWTSFSATDARSLYTTWSPDSSFLACVANFSGYADVGSCQLGEKMHTVRLRTYANEGDLLPQVRSEQPQVHLISNRRIMLYDFAQDTSTVWADHSQFGKLLTSQLCLSPNSEALALVANVANSPQLYLSSLSNMMPEYVDLSGKSAPPTVLYDIAVGLECAGKHWLEH